MSSLSNPHFKMMCRLVNYLISLFGESNSCAFVPSRLDIYTQNLVFDTGCASIVIHDL